METERDLEVQLASNHKCQAFKSVCWSLQVALMLASAVVSMPLRVPGMYLCPLDVSEGRLSGPTRTSSTWLRACTITVASSWQQPSHRCLTPSRLSPDLSTHPSGCWTHPRARLPWLSTSPIRVFVPPRHTRGVSLPPGSSSSTVVGMSFSDSPWPSTY